MVEKNFSGLLSNKTRLINMRRYVIFEISCFAKVFSVQSDTTAYCSLLRIWTSVVDIAIADITVHATTGFVRPVFA